MLEKLARDVQFTDVTRFCEQKTPECRWLDYKEKFNPGDKENYRISKIVSALANAHGGWILFGIEEQKDSQNRGIPGAIKGIEKRLRLGERIKQICLDRIYPPIVLDVGSCDVNDINEVVVVRVFESDSAPHQLSDGKVYIRTNDISHLADDGEEAKVRDIELLLNRRAKSLDLRNRLLERSQERFRINNASPQVRLACIPTFPDAPICGYETLSAVAAACRPFYAFRDSTRIHTAHESVFDSFARHNLEEGAGRRAMYEFNVYGLIYYTTQVAEERSPQGARYGIPSDVILGLLYSFLQAAEHFYRHASFSGLVDIELSLLVPSENAILLEKATQLNSIPVTIRDTCFSVERRVLTHRFNDSELISGIYRDFLWGAGYGTAILQSDRPERLVSALDEEAAFGKIKAPLT